MADVTLSASVRSSLLSLQNTTSLIERTQGRLSEGLRVASAVDDPVAFFQAKSLSDRARDLLEKKDGIDQGISTVTAALDGVESVEALVQQMKGVANSMKSATTAQITDLVTQYNDLRTQINNLTTDATYQGTNLINGTGQTLGIEFSEKTASRLDISSVDLQAGTAGLGITVAASYTGDQSVTHGEITVATQTNSDAGLANRYLSTTDDFALTWNASNATYAEGSTINFTYGSGSSFDLIVGSSSALTLANGDAIDVDVVTATDQIASTQDVGLVADSTRNLTVSYTQQTVTGFLGSATDAGTATFGTFSFTYLGNNAVTLTTADNGLILAVSTSVVSALTLNLTTGASLVLTGAGDVISLSVYSSVADLAATASAYTGAYILTTGGAATGMSICATTAGQAELFGYDLDGAQTSVASGGNITGGGLVSAGSTTEINLLITELDTALISLRTQASTLGSNVALLNTRLNFTETYVNTLQGGSDKLVLADINEEGANLLALQTRQQLGIQALSLAAQAEASILRLFG